MKKALLVALVLLFQTIPVGLAKISNSSRMIWVPDHYLKIQDAINTAENGDTIRVRAGKYDGNILISNKSISLIGDGADNTIIRGLGKSG